MPNLPISQLPNLSGATNETLLAVVYSGDGSPVTYHITLQDLIQSVPFGTVYQTILPDVGNTYDLGSPSNTFKSIHVGEGTVFIGQTGALGIDPQGILFSLSGFASNTLVLGGVINSGVTSTSGATFSLNENYDVILTNPTNTGATYNITQQLVTTGGTIGQVFTQTGNTNFEWGWTTLSSGTSGTSGIDGTSGTSGVSGTSGTSGVSGTSGTSGIDGTSGTSGVSGTSGTSGVSGTSGTSGIDGTSGTSGIDGTSGTSGVSGTSGSSGTSAPVSPYPIMYGLFSQTGSSVTVTGTTETTLINGGIGTLSVPASGFSVGDSFKVEMSGLLSVPNGQTLRIRVKANSIALLDSGVQTIVNNINDDIWELRVYFTIRQVGGAGTAILASNGVFGYSKQSNNSVEGFAFSDINDTTFDTTILNTLDITAEWGSINPTNAISTEIFVLNKIY